MSTAAPDQFQIKTSDLNVAPGSTVVVRDEEWLVTNVVETSDGPLVHVQGLSELVRGTTAQFFASLDYIEPLNPEEAKVTADNSPKYRDSRLWVEAMLRKTPVPITDTSLSVSPHMLADQLPYQAAAIQKALDPDNLRPRILLADAVGLGKTIEIGMILSELVRRGRGERILIVTPRHVLEQMQHEMWTRFALPFVRLDSAGIQRVRQKLPATRNPFTYYKRAIISIDTLKSDRYLAHLRHQKWDAVVIDESHNLTNSGTLNNRLARTLAPTADALILASATPHNGRMESFANLIRLLEPTAVRPDGEPDPDETTRLIIRRHRNSPEVAGAVGNDWAERKEPQHQLIPASAPENAVAQELEQTWLHPSGGSSPYSGKQDTLFGWTLAKAFLSSPPALNQSIDNRLKTLRDQPGDAAQHERDALTRLKDLNAASTGSSAKYDALVTYLKQIGVAKTSPMRAVVFAERVATLEWLKDNLPTSLKLPTDAVQVMHGGLSDEEQMRLIESFKQESSPIRVLVTGDVASEGVNLHAQCHELIHYDVPWSLIRIEQRNGRIDRYGQRHSPQITTLLLDPASERFKGDLKVLTRLLEREHAAHTALGDTASLMDKFSIGDEEDTVRQILAGKKDFDDTVRTVEQAVDNDLINQILNLGAAVGPAPATAPVPTASTQTSTNRPASYLYSSTLDYLRDALDAAFPDKSATLTDRPGEGGVEWREFPGDGIVQFSPPRDLRQRLDALPQTYLSDRDVKATFKLAVSDAKGKTELAAALADATGSSWPAAHFLGPQHPVVDWATDRALASLDRNHVYAMRGDVDSPTVLLVGTLTNKRGHVVAASHISASRLTPQAPHCIVTPHRGAQQMLDDAGVTNPQANPGPVAGVDKLQPLVRMAVRDTRASLETHLDAARQATTERVERWAGRATAWEREADALIQRSDIKTSRTTVRETERMIEEMRPDRYLVRPLLVVVPQDFTEGDI
ncbi:DEAD/DEAH box helicase [Demequina lignilytica]|uniref:DEAD/DEAH box helicase n=1 Tax=Demequina lignilytica TaxID=3051663 RepID=A0AB35MHC6_9MICO|nr:DEAD/DEAH box helicase [Demequina sp. SYSU T0a273]MDN4483207.1 DEAD/DEAH box helicase [Demequina sp. SYSU T0a273]